MHTAANTEKNAEMLKFVVMETVVVPSWVSGSKYFDNQGAVLYTHSSLSVSVLPPS